MLQAGSDRGWELIKTAPGVKNASRKQLAREVANRGAGHRLVHQEPPDRGPARASDEDLRASRVQRGGRGPVPRVQQLCDGLPDLLLLQGRGPVGLRSADGASEAANGMPVRTMGSPRCIRAIFASPQPTRLRQFMTHKLCTWLEQYGCFGCIGCGRCMTWCPTGIDITEMAKGDSARTRRGE